MRGGGLSLSLLFLSFSLALLSGSLSLWLSHEIRSEPPGLGRAPAGSNWLELEAFFSLREAGRKLEFPLSGLLPGSTLRLAGGTCALSFFWLELEASPQLLTSALLALSPLPKRPRLHPKPFPHPPGRVSNNLLWQELAVGPLREDGGSWRTFSLPVNVPAARQHSRPLPSL